MIDKKFFEPFDGSLSVRAELTLRGLTEASCVHFLHSMTREFLEKIGHGILAIYPDKNHKAISDLLPGEKTSKDKVKMNKLLFCLREDPMLTAEEFLKK